jgi:hypothetical protein
VTLPRLGAITLDGVVGDAEWAGALEVEGIMHVPDFGAEPSERTVFFLAYDDQYIYFACRAFDSEPDQVRITTLARDVSTFNTDACGLRLDTYNDEENSLLFNTTPAGVRTDWAFANDATGPPNQDWNAFWDAAGTLTGFGWSAEIRIPFSSLGFQAEEGRTVMGFSLARSIVRRNEQTVHPAIAPNWGPASLAKPSQMRKMILTGLEPEHPVYVTPYGLRLADSESDTGRIAAVIGSSRGSTQSITVDPGRYRVQLFAPGLTAVSAIVTVAERETVTPTFSAWTQSTPLRGVVERADGGSVDRARVVLVARSPDFRSASVMIASCESAASGEFALDGVPNVPGTWLAVHTRDGKVGEFWIRPDADGRVRLVVE